MTRGGYGVPKQVYGAILPGATTVARLLPAAAAVARIERALSAKARHRLKILRWYEDHGKKARLTCRHFGISPDSFYCWLQRYRRQGVRGLEDRSRRPHRVRRPTVAGARQQQTTELLVYVTEG